MKYLIVSYTHKNTDISTREKLSCSSEMVLKKFYDDIHAIDEVDEVLILSTCNRVEILMSVSSHDGVVSKVEKVLIENTTVSEQELSDKGESYKDEDAIYHLFCVGASLDSLVVGETQIVGQLKDAFRFSFDNGYSGQKITRAMIHTFKCSGGVRSKTNITKNPVSVASVAVAKAKDLYGGNLGGFTGVVVGAGEMGELVAKHLAGAGANIIIINRNIEKAMMLAQKLENVNVVVEPFSKLKEMVNGYRLLFSATGASESIIDKTLVEDVTFERHWFDIAVPRDIEDCGCKNINIYAVDDLKDIVEKNIQERQYHAKDAYKIVDDFMYSFYKWLHTLNIDPIIKQMRENARSAARDELNRAIKKGYIDSSSEEAVSKILHGAFNSFLHAPTSNLKEIAGTSKADTVVQSVQLVFDINQDTQKTLNSPKCDYLMEKDILKKDKS